MHKQNDQASQDAQNKAMDTAKSSAKKGTSKLAKAPKGIMKTARHGKNIMIFMIKYWWLILSILGSIAFILFLTIIMAFFMGAGNNGSNPCAKYEPSLDDNVKTVHGNVSQAPHNYINRISGAARKIAPHYDVLPSIVIADAGQENSAGPGYNFWGLGYYDNTPVNNQSFHNVDEGVIAYVKTAVKDTAGRIQTSDAKAGLQAMADASPGHPPEQAYHQAPASQYWPGLISQWKMYNLSKYDQGIHMNKSATSGNLNDIKVTANDGQTSTCTSTGASGSSSSSIFNFAARYDGKLPYSEPQRTEFGSDLPNPKSNDHADCSSFVWGVLKAMGYQVDTNKQWTTADMVRTNKLKHLRSNQTRKGDLLVVDGQSNPSKDHAMILASDKWYGASNPKTRVIDEGGAASHVNQSSYSDAMGGSIQPEFLRGIKK